MKCGICRVKKGKRHCPARSTEICATCCGKKRVVEIECPTSCSYLTSGQSYQSQKRFDAQFRNQEEFETKLRLLETRCELGGLIFDFEAEIVYHSTPESLSDREVLRALELLRQSYRTEQKGIIYQPASPDPRVRGLVTALRDFVEAERLNYDVSLRTHEIVNLLDCLIFDLNYHCESSSHQGTYLDFIAKNHPDMAECRASRTIELVHH